MKAIVYRSNGNPEEVLAIEDVADLSAPGPNEVAVRIIKRMVHPIDDLLVRGIVPAPIPQQGAIPGGDGVGIVEKVGADVDPSTGIIPGAHVMLFPVHGTWAERIVAPATSVIAIPTDVNDAAACQIIINGITAINLLHAATASDKLAGTTSPLVVTAAGSGVGRNLVALARMRGAKVIGVVRSEAGAAILANSFAGLPVISTDKADWRAGITSAYGEAPSVIFDPVGGEMTSQFLDLLANRGTLLTYGGLDARPSMISTIAMTVRGLAIKGVNAPGWVTSTSAEQKAADISELFEMTRQAPQNFLEYQEFTLDEAVKALSATQVAPRRGATILTSGG